MPSILWRRLQPRAFGQMLRSPSARGDVDADIVQFDPLHDDPRFKALLASIR
jgi:hypothetical protein